MSDNGFLLLPLRDTIEAINKVIVLLQDNDREIPAWLSACRKQFEVEYEVISSSRGGHTPLLLPGERGTL